MGVQVTGAHDASSGRPAVSTPSARTRWWRRVALVHSMRLAVTNFIVMARNVLVSTVMAGAASWLLSRGLSSTSAAPPSRTAFLLWSLGISHLLASVVTTIVHSYALMRFKYIALHGLRGGVFFCVKRFTAGTWVYFVVTNLALLLVGWACTRPWYPVGADKFRIDFYADMVLCSMYSVAGDIHVREIFFHETVNGQVKRPSQSPMSTDRTSSFAALVATRAWTATRIYANGILRDLPSLGSLLVAGGYVHFVSQFPFSPVFPIKLFMGGSFLFKLAVQEMAKHYLVKKNVTNLLHMCTVVFVPTVLIDTQVRVAMLASQGAGATMANSYWLAIIEITFRLLKVVRLHWVLNRPSMAVLAKANSRQSHSTATVVAVAQSTEHEPLPDPAASVQNWTSQIIGLHIAETQADMYAEYIAIVCSGAIALLWSSNPHYTISETIGKMSGDVLVKALLYQVGLEIIVDYCALTMEIFSGVGTAQRDREQAKLGSFLGFIATKLAVVNMNISAILYIQPR